MFIDSMKFMNSSLDQLAKSLSDEDFKDLVEEFGSKSLELLKQKDAHPYEYMNSFKKLMKKNCQLKIIFIALQKMEKSMMMVKYQTVT